MRRREQATRRERAMFHVEHPRAPGSEPVITIAVLSQKGGVGKTLTCANLAAGLADAGLAVVMVDFDPQADLSSSWALDERGARPLIEDALEQADVDVGDVLEHIPLGDGTGSLALLPTAYERLRRQTAR